MVEAENGYYREAQQEFIPALPIPYVNVSVGGINRRLSIPQATLPFPRAELSFPVGLVTGYKPNSHYPTRLRQIDENHQRSHELDVPIIFADQYNNAYTGFASKGDAFVAPQLEILARPKADAFPRARVRGLQDDQSIGRIAVVSDFFRQHGFATEFIAAAHEPLLFWLNGSWMTLDTFKENLLQSYVISDPYFFDEDPQEYTEAAQSYLSQVRFIRTIRAMRVTERLQALLSPNPHRADLFFHHALPKLTLIEKTKQILNPKYSAFEFDPNSHDSRYTYLMEYLPLQITSLLNFTREQQILLDSHHEGNWDGSGVFVDLDSVEGTVLGLGDEAVDPKKIENEHQWVLDRLGKLQTRAFEYGHVKHARALFHIEHFFSESARRYRTADEEIVAKLSPEQRFAYFKFAEIRNVENANGTDEPREYYASLEDDLGLSKKFTWSKIDFSEKSRCFTDFMQSTAQNFLAAFERSFFTPDGRPRPAIDLRKMVVQGCRPDHIEQRYPGFLVETSFGKRISSAPLTFSDFDLITEHIFAQELLSPHPDYDYIVWIQQNVRQQAMDLWGEELIELEKIYGQVVIDNFLEAITKREAGDLGVDLEKGVFRYATTAVDELFSDLKEELWGTFLGTRELQPNAVDL